MSDGIRQARDLQLLDTVDAFAREQFSGRIWRVAREGRDPLQGSPSRSRWCDGTFDVLYTSLERDGAISEVHALLSLQPVFPSKIQWFVHELKVSIDRTMKLADLSTLARLGVEVARYGEREYERTQAITDAAFFLGFDGLIAPSARWTCSNLVLFMDRVLPDRIELVETSKKPIAWETARKRRGN